VEESHRPDVSGHNIVEEGPDSPGSLVIAVSEASRTRRQGFVYRRLYRRKYERKYDTVKTLEASFAKLRNETDLDALNGNLVGVVEETSQGNLLPNHRLCWLNGGYLVRVPMNNSTYSLPPRV
jgi:hypothetical protein